MTGIASLLFSILLFFFLHPAFAQEKIYDYVIKGALVFDGESLVPARKDVALSGDRIMQTGKVPREEAKEVIEAQDWILSPGFIDIHTHSDFMPFTDPSLGNKVRQGVTTEVVGNCGMSAAPLEGRHEKEIANVWKREGVNLPAKIPWKTFKEYAGEAEFQGLETNFIGLVGHGNLRSAVMGMEPRPAKPEEIESMKQSLREALENGALGVSFGLVYLPGVFAAREEVAALCGEAAQFQGICVFHMRSEGKGLVEAVKEVLEAARNSKAQVHISHLKAAGEKNWPKIKEVFQQIEQARAEGLQVTADAYPYTASFAELGVVLPNALYQDPDRVSRFQDPQEKEKVLAALRTHYQTNPVSWDRILVATVSLDKNGLLQGKSLLEISQAAHRAPEEALVDLLGEEEFKVSAFYFSQSEAVVEEVLSKPYVAAGSDSVADGSLLPHPRAFGTFPKILARCPKGEAAIKDPCWGRAIHQMTGLPAAILGLKDRGRIGSGLVADLVLFDPAKIRDRADYQNPKAVPEGIQWVFVNGKPVVHEGDYESLHSGLFLVREK